jgi:hypothetical protein
MEENPIDKDELRDLFQKANAVGDDYLWGFHWGRPGDGFDKLTGFDFENDLLRIHMGDRDKRSISVYSPRGFQISKGPEGEAILHILDARRVRCDWPGGPGQEAWHLEFWKMDGDIYGKSNGDWPTNTGVGIGDQSQPALRVAVFRAPSFLLTDVSGRT